jgi:hypothetical protein
VSVVGRVAAIAGASVAIAAAAMVGIAKLATKPAVAIAKPVAEPVQHARHARSARKRSRRARRRA